MIFQHFDFHLYVPPQRYLNYDGTFQINFAKEQTSIHCNLLTASSFVQMNRIYDRLNQLKMQL